MVLSAAALTALGSVGSSVLGSGISGAFNFMSSRSSALKQFQYAQALANYQYKLQRKLNQNAYQDTTYSMREAGINPMLAISNGASGGSVGLQSAPNVTPAQMDIDLQGAFTSAKQLKNDTKRVENETRMTDSNVDKQEAESNLAKQNSKFIESQNNLLEKYGDSLKLAELSNLEKTGQMLDSQSLSFASNTAKNYADITNNAKVTAAQVANLLAGAGESKSRTKGQDIENAKNDVGLKFLGNHPIASMLGISPTGLGNAVPAAAGLLLGGAGLGFTGKVVNSAYKAASGAKKAAQWNKSIRAIKSGKKPLY